MTSLNLLVSLFYPLIDVAVFLKPFIHMVLAVVIVALPFIVAVVISVVVVVVVVVVAVVRIVSTLHLLAS